MIVSRFLLRLILLALVRDYQTDMRAIGVKIRLHEPGGYLNSLVMVTACDGRVQI